MSQVDPAMDLSALTRGPVLEPPRRRPLRLLFPALLVLGFALLLWVSFQDMLATHLQVTVVRPRPATMDESQPAMPTLMSHGTVVQAAGWIEPDPFPVLVPALTEGVVQQLHVQESDAVQAGQVLAGLVADDAAIAHSAAEAGLAAAVAAVKRAQVEHRLAVEDYTAALAVTEARQITEAAVQARRAEVEQRGQAAKAARAAVRIASEELTLQELLAADGAAGPRQLELARAKVELATAEALVRDAEVQLAIAALAEARARATRAARDLELRIADRRTVQVAEAEVQRLEAMQKVAEADLASAKLRLERHQVRAPANGVVLRRLVEVGSTVGPQHALVSLFDPAHLRVRVDVPLAEIQKIEPGQRAEILAESRPGRIYQGQVIRIISEADIQKVTLQVHVRVDDPDAGLRPEMLCQVRLVRSSVPPMEGMTDTEAAPGRHTIPARVLRDRSVFVVDPDGRARRRALTVLSTGGEQVVVTGLSLTDKVIDEVRGGETSKLVEGVRVRIVR